jgi:hypothetical protein
MRDRVEFLEARLGHFQQRLRLEGFNEYNREDATGSLAGKQCAARGLRDDV